MNAPAANRPAYTGAIVYHTAPQRLLIAGLSHLDPYGRASAPCEGFRTFARLRAGYPQRRGGSRYEPCEGFWGLRKVSRSQMR